MATADEVRTIKAEIYDLILERDALHRAIEEVSQKIAAKQRVLAEAQRPPSP